MNPACQQYRTNLPEGPDGRLHIAALTAPSMEGHSAECGECAAWVQSLSRLSESLYELPRCEAPASLDGLVVATLHAGEREARAVRAVEGLSRMHSPETLAETVAETVEHELDEALEPPVPMQEPRIGAPSVLERLVREELAEPEQNAVRRAVGSLPRLEAPAELDALVRHSFQQPNTPHGSEGEGRRPLTLLRGKRLAWASLAAAVLLLLGPFGLGALRDGEPRQDPPAARQRPFEVVYASSLNDLDPVARSLVDGVSGGLLSAKGL